MQFNDAELNKFLQDIVVNGNGGARGNSNSRQGKAQESSLRKGAIGAGGVSSRNVGGRKNPTARYEGTAVDIGGIVAGGTTAEFDARNGGAEKVNATRDARESVEREEASSYVRRVVGAKKRKASRVTDSMKHSQATWSSAGSDREEDDTVTNSNMSMPEKKREREKQRREVMNTRFAELSLMLPRAINGRADKESILAEAVDRLKKNDQSIRDLHVNNQNLRTEIEELRNEKVELRADKSYLRAELDSAREEVKTLRDDHMMLWHYVRQQMSGGGPHPAGLTTDPTLEAALRGKFMESARMHGGASNGSNPSDASKITSHNECA